MALTIPEQGGDVLLLTQLYWPLVHPALQEDRQDDDKQENDDDSVSAHTDSINPGGARFST